MVSAAPALLPSAALLLAAVVVSPALPSGPDSGRDSGTSVSTVRSRTHGSATAPTRVGPGGATPPDSGAPHRPAQPQVAPRHGWHWPLSPRPTVVAPFRAPQSSWGAGHRGVDLAAARGQQVLSAAAGRVTHVGVVAGRGTLTVLHRDGVRTTYEPVVPRVRHGDVVTAGQVVGVVAEEGSSHCARCLHFGALRGRVYLDPLALLERQTVVLLPLR